MPVDFARKTQTTKCTQPLCGDLFAEWKDFDKSFDAYLNDVELTFYNFVLVAELELSEELNRGAIRYDLFPSSFVGRYCINVSPANQRTHHRWQESRFLKE